METTILDPVTALLTGREHYRRPVPEPRGEPTLQEQLAEMAASCTAPMVAIEGQGGQVIGYRCPRCEATATPEGRTEHGPREILTYSQAGDTALYEPELSRAIDEPGTAAPPP